MERIQNWILECPGYNLHLHICGIQYVVMMVCFWLVGLRGWSAQWCGVCISRGAPPSLLVAQATRETGRLCKRLVPPLSIHRVHGVVVRDDGVSTGAKSMGC